MHAPRQHPKKRLLRLQLNGRWREDAIPEGALLVDYLREVARLTGTKTGCDGGGVRSVHCPDRRRGRTFVHHPRRALRRAQRGNYRGLGNAGTSKSTAAGLPRKARDTMRILYAGNDHGGRSASEAQSEAN